MFDKGRKGRRKSNFTDFFNKNRSLTILLPLLLVSIIALIIVYSTMGNTAKPSSSQISLENGEMSGQIVDVLPQIERVKNTNIKINENVKDPFSSEGMTMQLKGITLYEDRNTAILETQNNAYVVSEGNKIEQWTVQRIDMDSVLLVDSQGNEFILKYE
ncbi:MAG: hypothetical protein GX213_00025 [Clostridiaceae bacterium]|nr:hypothetical protein [Clostridiaceae bacterium]